MKDFFLEFLTRPGCHLCEEALPVTRRVATLMGAGLVETQIDSDDSLVAEFGLRIPVVRDPSGSVLAEGTVRFGHLLRRTAASRLRALI